MELTNSHKEKHVEEVCKRKEQIIKNVKLVKVIEDDKPFDTHYIELPNSWKLYDREGYTAFGILTEAFEKIGEELP